MQKKMIVTALAVMFLAPALPTALAYGCSTTLVNQVCADSTATAGPSPWAGTATYTSKGWGSSLGIQGTVTMSSSKTAGASCVTGLAGGSCETDSRWTYSANGCNTVSTNSRNLLFSKWDYEVRCYGTGLDADPLGLALTVVADTEDALWGH